jgi:hypothetical protein
MLVACSVLREKNFIDQPMDKFRAKNAFKRQKKFFTQLRNGHSAPDTFSKDQSRALLYLLHFLVVGQVPIKSVAFIMLESH